MVFLQRLSLRNFRNFEEEVVEFPQAGAALIGDNGQGKTNLLEAVYYLEIFRSFRGARDEQLVSLGRQYFRVEGSLVDAEGDGRTEVSAAYSRDGRRKKVSIAGREAVRLGDAIGRVGAIIFTASDVDIVVGGPSIRRRYLDIVLSLAEPSYLAALQRYRQVLSQRNGLLRDGAGPVELAAWNSGLVENGIRIFRARAAWVASVRKSFARYYGAISGGQEVDLEYRPVVKLGDLGAPSEAEESWRSAFLAELERQSERERRRGLSLVGPHRDDLGFRVADGESNRLALRNYGSAGQQRTAAVALRMVEAETLRRSGGRRPIVMLDDVFAELDPSRAERVVGLLTAEEWGQIIVTSPKPDEFAIMGASLPEYRIRNGRVRRS
ncbi:MAG: DNA replication and repair protein RecF [Gemmatimonadales bacterium]|jgi:DNA replication and repair protein RecF